MAVATAEQLLGLLKKCNLLNADQWEAARKMSEQGVEPRAVLKQIVERGWLTRWQAQQIYNGVATLILGKYKLLDRIGAGGMGTVYKAEHEAMGRIVALKVISRELTSNAEAVARFHREVHSAARLNHPNIVTAYDADNRGDTHFLVMEYVDGASLDAWLKEHGQLPIDWACECARQVAIGLDHAHKKGMVHRDIKPKNILVISEEPGALPSIKILDMGLARLEERADDDEGLTKSDQILGTPDFMSPEQAEDSRTADIRSDIYSLGCTLFKLLTGQPPFLGATVMEKLTARLRRDAPLLRTLRPEAPRGLENVVAKMLAREPQERYQTPSQVADDLSIYCMTQTGGDEDSQTISLCREERPTSFSQAGSDSALSDFLSQLSSHIDQNTPVAGSTRTLVEQPRNTPFPSPLARRRKESAMTARVAGLMASLAAGGLLLMGFLLWHFTRPSTVVLDWPLDQRRGAKITIDEREVPMSREAKWEVEVGPGTHRVLVLRRGYEPTEVEKPLSRGERWVYRPEFTRAKTVSSNFDAAAAQSAAASEQEQLKAWQTRQQDRLANLAAGEAGRAKELSQLEAQADPQQLSQDPFVLATLRAEINDFRARHAGTREAAQAGGLLSRLPAAADGLERSKISPYELSAAGAGDAAQAPRQLVGVLGDTRFSHSQPIHCTVYSHNGRLLASAGSDNLIKLWDPATGELVRVLKDGHTSTVSGIAFTRDDKLLVSTSYDGTAKIWEVETGQKGLTLRNESKVNSLALGRDDKLLACACIDKTVRIWDLASGSEVHTFPGHVDEVLAVDFSPVDDLVASVGKDRIVKIWDARTGDVRFSFDKHTAPLHSVRFSPNGKRVASGGADSLTRLWDLETGQEWINLPWTGGAVWHLAFSHDGKTLAANSKSALWLWDLAASGTLPKLEIPVDCVAFSPDDRTLAVAGGRSVKLLTLPGGEQTLPLPGHDTGVWGLCFAPDGRTLISGAADNALRFWDVATATEKLHRPTSQVTSVAISPDGKQVLFAMYNQTYLLLWDLQSGREKLVLKGHTAGSHGVAISPDGKTAASASGDATIKLWDLVAGTEKAHLAAHVGAVHSVAFSPEGSLLASVGADLHVRLWDVATADAVLTLKGHTSPLNSVVFSPDGQWLATAGGDQMVFLWDLATGAIRHKLQGHTGAISRLAFSPDGKSLLSTSTDQTIRQWDLNSGQEKQSLKLEQSPPCQLAFSPEGRHLAVGLENGVIQILRWFEK